jgi:AcrR family transcriptional regulator
MNVFKDDAMDTPPLSQKALDTRQLIFETALKLFIEKGYEQTTMREIAANAETSLGLTYRYFSSKEELVVELYRRDAQRCAERAAALETGEMAARFDVLMRGILEDVTPRRFAYDGFFGAAMNPRSPVGVLSERMGSLRREVRDTFIRVVQESSDAPKNAEQATNLGSLLYVAHLLILLFWISDSTPNFRATEQLLVFSRDTLGLIRGALILPPISKGIQRMTGIVEQIFVP